ncbi:MAG: phosphatase PAP2 family protein [Ruminococcaceae bacterium]|nr:phosphatase PAP2 family protein [Oscillospiraceae bacterium]
MAAWLDSVFFSFDYGILNAIHKFAMATGGPNSFFTWFMRFISLLGEEGICLIVTGALLCLFKKTRKVGFAVLGAMFCSAIITNITLKPLVLRTRPFNNTEVEAFRVWWEEIGATHAGAKSFPSGHTSSAMAAMGALFLTLPKKYSWTSFIFVLLTGLSRMYLMVHYPTDIIGGILAGALSAVGGYFIAMGLLALLRHHEKLKFCGALLRFDLIELCRRGKTVPAQKERESIQIAQTTQPNQTEQTTESTPDEK